MADLILCWQQPCSEREVGQDTSRHSFRVMYWRVRNPYVRQREIYGHNTQALCQNTVCHWSHVLFWKIRMLANWWTNWAVSLLRKEFHFLLFRKCLVKIKKTRVLTSVFDETFPVKTNNTDTNYMTMNHSFVRPTPRQTKNCKASMELNSRKAAKAKFYLKVREPVSTDHLDIFQHFQKCSNILQTHKEPNDRRVTICHGDLPKPKHCRVKIQEHCIFSRYGIY